MLGWAILLVFRLAGSCSEAARFLNYGEELELEELEL